MLSFFNRDIIDMVSFMKKKIVIVCLIIIFILFGGFISLYYFTEPNLMIVGSSEIDIPLNGDYQDEGARLYLFNKDYSKDIKTTGDIDFTKVGSYKITYSYKSKYLYQTCEEIRTVNVVDNKKPDITLEGKDTYTIYYTDSKKASFKEKGYHATDNYDGDLTDKVQIIDEVDYEKKGTYKIIYKVKDSSNNETSVERTIIVKKKSVSPSNAPTTNVVTDGDDTSITVNKTGTGRGIPILMYHRFYSKEAGEVGEDANYVEINDFEEQVKYLKENNYYFPSWSEVRDFVDGKINLPSKSVVITMDDWHKSVPKYAVPILNKYEVPGTAFLITVYETGLYFKNYKSPYINFESHTHNMHRGGCKSGANGLFRCINHEAGVKDLQTSISIVGNSDAIAYPFGDVNNNVLAITKEVGFKVGVTTKFGRAKKGMDPLMLPRIRVSKGESLRTFISHL